MTDPALDPKLYYKSEARPISRLLVLYNRCGCGKDFPFEKWLDYRDKARKDLFWLGKTILKKDLTTCHEVPCNGLFVSKDFDGVYHEDYTIGEVHQAIDRQKRIKEMLWLDPRGAFKSTIDGIDCVQWLLNCPDIRILILTGEYKLALAFLSEIKGYFYRPDKEDPSLLQQLFPEYTITGKDGESEQPLDCPARVHVQKEPSLWVNAIVANLSGWHCFAAGTLITCRRGLVPIERVTTEDSVLTRKGWKNVLRAGVTGIEKTINFMGLSVTPGHKVFTLEEGFSSIMSFICQGTRNLLIHKESFLRALSSGAIQALEHIPTEPTFEGIGEEEKNYYTEPSGNLHMGLFLAGPMCTTRTMTQATTRLMGATTNSRRESSIGVIMEIDRENIFPSISTSYASIAEWISCAEIENESVANLAISFTEEPPLLPATTVYDLQVEDCHEFFANGILVHNCDIRKMDDVVTDENSNSVDARGPEGKLKMKIDGTDNLVDEWGFTDSVGTRYYTDDYYGERVRAAGNDAPLRYLCRAAWKLKPEFEGTPLLQIKAEMVHLLFPEKLSFKSLRQKLSKNQIMFRCQQLNEPAADQEAITFDEDSLRSHLVAKIPEDGKKFKKFVAWDTSYAKTNSADYSAGVCGMVTTVDNESTLYILDIIFGKWKPSELAQHMIQFDLKHNPETTLIEEISDAEFLKRELQRLSNLRQSRLNIIWKKASTAADAKRNRIKSLETLLNNDQLWFKNGDWIDETFSQFRRYTGERKNKGRKDDIPDAVAYLQFFVPSSFDNQELREAQEMRERKARQQAMYDRYFTPPKVPVPVYKEPSLKRKLFGSLANA